MNKWQRSLYLPYIPMGENGRRLTASAEHLELSRKAAREGAVLLKNEDNILPLKNGKKIALFGKAISDYVQGGGGSGAVNSPYSRSLSEAMAIKEKEGKLSLYSSLVNYYEEYVKREYSNGKVPGLIQEPLFPVELADRAKDECDVALIAISRFSGENWDRVSDTSIDYDSDDISCILAESKKLFSKGDFYLSDSEEKMVEGVLQRFSSIIVVLNVGGIVDTKWFAFNENIKGVIQAFQGGSEGGLAIADLLVGEVSPSGKLSDTYAKDLKDYPSYYNFHDSNDYVDYTEDIFVGYRYFNTIPGAYSSVVYPFGYGLSYTTFLIEEQNYTSKSFVVSLDYKITNNGLYEGKEVLQIYVECPKGKLEKPKLTLVDFAKTKLLAPGESDVLHIEFPLSVVSSFDDDNTIADASWVLEKGRYVVFYGNSSDSLTKSNIEISLSSNIVIEECSHLVSPTKLSKRMKADGSFKTCVQREKNTVEPLFERQDISLLEGVIPTGHAMPRLTRKDLSDSSYHLERVTEGKLSLGDFISKLDIDTLIDMTGGQPNTGIGLTYGFGNHLEYGIPNIMTADGPAGLRTSSESGIFATAWPCSTLLASTWDSDLVYAIGKAASLEVKENNLSVWLTPAVNIHRSPLCGRNFEYYSEDPLLTGKLAASMVKAIQSSGIAACVKHFACNNKETNRKESDSRVSEKALREIYLKQFEIIVKTSNPIFVMSSYNLINGVRAAENKELLTSILRDEWGFEGAVVSDWWNHSEHYLELLAGEDLKMGTGYPERVRKAYEMGAITRKDIELNVSRLLQAMLNID